MNIFYKLNDDEINNVIFTPMLISTRENRPGYYKPGHGNFEQSYIGSHRRDMFWIKCELNGVDLGSLCIEPSLINPEFFTIVKNHCKVLPLEPLIKKAKKWFVGQPEYQNQVKWTKILIENIKKDKKNNFLGARKTN